jgi:hypothetical protein
VNLKVLRSAEVVACLKERKSSEEVLSTHLLHSCVKLLSVICYIFYSDIQITFDQHWQLVCISLRRLQFHAYNFEWGPIRVRTNICNYYKYDVSGRYVPFYVLVLTL